MTRTENYIDGDWREGSGEAFASRDPAKGETVWSGRAANADEVREAFAAARTALAGFALKPFAERREIAERYRDIVKARGEEFAQAISRETGKPLWEARGEAGARGRHAGRRVGRAVERDIGQFRQPFRQLVPLGDDAAVDALPRGVDVPIQIDHVTEFQRFQILPADRSLQADCLSASGCHEMSFRR